VHPKVPVHGTNGFVILDTRCPFIAGFGFLPVEDGIKVFNHNPARVIPALGTIR
jgi:hypothetical protein